MAWKFAVTPEGKGAPGESKSRRMTVALELSVLQPPSEGLGYIAGLAITDQLLVAAGGTSSRWPTVLATSDARHFEPRKTPRQLGLRDVLAAGDVLWACGEYGQLAISRDRGAAWKLVDTGTDACLFALALEADGAVWVVGDRGYVARVVGERLERVELGTTARLAAVYAVGDEIVMLGCDGALYRRHGDEVARIATGATRPLSSLVVTRLGTWIVTGDGGFIARSPDGAWWSRVASGTELDLEASCACSDGQLIVVGDRGLILGSTDDGRRWQPVATDLVVHLWSVERFGAGVVIGGDQGLIAKLAPPGDQTWHDRVDVFGGGKPLDAAFARGPDGFIANGLPAYLAVVGGERTDADIRGRTDDDGGEADREAAAALAGRGTGDDFAANYGVAMPAELAALFSAVEARDRWSTFAELRVDGHLLPDVGARNLFELLVRRDQHAELGTGLVEAFCGAFGIGSQESGDRYFMELYEWDGPRQVLHFDHETRAFTGVIADSLDSLVYLAALARARETRRISDEAFAIGLGKLHGKVAPTWHFAIEDADPAFVALDAKRRDTEFFFYRARWICALLQDRGDGDLAEIPALFNADFNQVVPVDQLPARYEACERVIPTALYSMWRAFLFDEPELGQYLEIGRRHRSRLVRDAATLIDELRAGRNELGRIRDVRAHLAAFRALDLDPRRTARHEADDDARAQADAARYQAITAELARTPRAGWAELAWRWLDDSVAHHALLRELQATPALAAQLAAIDELRILADADREVMVRWLARELTPELEAVLAGSLLRGDRVAGGLAGHASAKPVSAPPPSVTRRPRRPAAVAAPDRVRAALRLTERALRLAPGDADTQFTHAILLLDADRAGLAGALEELLGALPGYAAAIRIQVAVRMGELAHPRVVDALDAALAEPDLAADDDVGEELLGDLAHAVIEHAPERLAALVPRLPAAVGVLASVAWHASQADRNDDALALYARLVELPVPEPGDERTTYLHALDNACVQAHAAKAYTRAVEIADRAQPVAHENPHLYHSAACAYAAVGEYVKALEQIRLAIEHDYEQLGEVEVDTDLGPLLDWPEFKALFRDWHARQEGN